MLKPPSPLQSLRAQRKRELERDTPAMNHEKGIISAFAAEGGDHGAAGGGLLPRLSHAGAPPRSASTPAGAAAPTAEDTGLRRDMTSQPASGGFDRRGAARFSLARALQAGSACYAAAADAAAQRLETELHRKFPANSSAYEQRYFKLASQLRASATQCQLLLTGGDATAFAAVFMLDIDDVSAGSEDLAARAAAGAQAASLLSAGAHDGGGAAGEEAAPPAASAPASPHHPAGQEAPPEPNGGEGREASPRRGGGAQWSGASAAAADVAANAAHDPRSVEQLRGQVL